MLTNPDLTPFYTGQHGVHPDGWATEQADGNYQVIPSEDAANPDGIHKYCYEYWSDPAKNNRLFNLYTTVENLPVGTYNMSCYAFAQDQYAGTNTAGVYFYANDTQGSQVTNTTLTEQNVEFVNNTIQNVKIGLKPTATNTYNWMGIGYLKLYKVPAKSFTLDCDDEWDYTQEGAGDVVVMNRPIVNGFNTVVFPFSMTQAEVEDYFGTGSTVSVLRSYDVNSEILHFIYQDGIQANKPCLLKAMKDLDPGDYITIPDRTIVAAESIHPTFSVENATMTGTYEGQTDVPTNSWFVQNNKLVYAEVGSICWVNMTRAYITLGDGSAPVKNLNVAFDDDEATGIAIVENGQLNVLTGKAYDLSGREVKNPTKGLYIIDGKKVFLK